MRRRIPPRALSTRRPSLVKTLRTAAPAEERRHSQPPPWKTQRTTTTTQLHHKMPHRHGHPRTAPTTSPRRNYILHCVKYAENTYSPKPRRHIYTNTVYTQNEAQIGNLLRATAIRAGNRTASVKAKVSRQRPARCRLAGCFEQWLDLPFNTLAKPGEVGGARGNQPPETLNCCMLHEGL